PSSLDLRQPSRLNQPNEDVPLLLLEDGGVRVFADSDLIAVDDDLRASGAPRAKRVPFHMTSPPLASMCGQMAAWSPSVRGHALRMPRTSVKSVFKSASFCINRRRTWAHGAAPERRRPMMCLISASVSPSVRHCCTKLSKLRISSA